MVDRKDWKLATSPNLILDTLLTFIQIRRKETGLIRTPESITEVISHKNELVVIGKG